MSANAEASTSSRDALEDGPQEAGPLPTKVGEIGYTAEMAQVDLTDASPSAGPQQASASNAAGTTSRATSPTALSVLSKRSALSRFFHKRTLGGVSNSVLLRIILLFLLIGFTATGWALTIINYQSPSTSSSPDPNSSTDGLPSNSQGAMKMSSIIFIHIAFAVGIILELLFFERAIFQARAERYNHVNGSPTGSTASTVMGLAPWNRPPLPTYAAAIAGRTTGDVEDAIIVQPPPPAYGHIRGSVLLLAGRLRDSMRSQRTVRQSGASTVSRAQPMTEARTERPISYGESEEVSDAARARALENTLARLEEGSEPQRRGQ